MIGERVAQLSAELCDGKTIDLLASGYNARVLPYAWLSLICGLGGIQLPVPDPEPIPETFRKDSSLDDTRRAVQDVKRRLKDSWRCLG